MFLFHHFSFTLLLFNLSLLSSPPLSCLISRSHSRTGLPVILCMDLCSFIKCLDILSANLHEVVASGCLIVPQPSDHDCIPWWVALSPQESCSLLLSSSSPGSPRRHINRWQFDYRADVPIYNPSCPSALYRVSIK